MSRIRIDKQTELSSVAGSVIVTNNLGEQEYIPPGTNGTVFTVVGGVPEWATATSGTKHAHALASSAYYGGSPLNGWIQPPGADIGDTIVIKYTDNVLGFFTYDGLSWVLNFTTNEPITTFSTLAAANIALGLGVIFRYTDDNPGGYLGLEVTH